MECRQQKMFEVFFQRIGQQETARAAGIQNQGQGSNARASGVGAGQTRTMPHKQINPVPRELYLGAMLVWLLECQE